MSYKLYTEKLTWCQRYWVDKRDAIQYSMVILSIFTMILGLHLFFVFHNKLSPLVIGVAIFTMISSILIPSKELLIEFFSKCDNDCPVDEGDIND